MFTIFGGATEFNQWDLNQKVTESSLVVGDKVIFQNSSGQTYPMKAYSYNGEVVVDVPNILLQEALPIVVYSNNHCHETRSRINVVAQNRPEGYVFVDNDDWPSEGDGNLASAMPKTINLTNYAINDDEGDTLNNTVLGLYAMDGGSVDALSVDAKFWEDVSTEQSLRIAIDGTPFNMSAILEMEGVSKVVTPSNRVTQISGTFRGIIQPGVLSEIGLILFRNYDEESGTGVVVTATNNVLA